MEQGSETNSDATHVGQQQNRYGFLPNCQQQMFPKIQMTEQEQKNWDKENQILLKKLNEFREDSENKYTLVKPTFQILTHIMVTWMQRPIRNTRFLMTLELNDVDEGEISIDKIKNIFQAVGSVKLIVNGKVIQNDAVLVQNGEYYYEGTQKFMIIFSESNKSLYRGEVIKVSNEEYRYHGRGVLLFGNKKEGFQYQGEFVNGKRHGHGRLKTKLNTYQGYFQNDYKHGPGMQTTFKRKKRNVPQPVLIPKAIYKGDFKQGYRQGEGQQLMLETYHYKGQWKHNEKCGKGQIKYLKNQDTYVGQWQKDAFNGIGKYIQKNNCTYEGEFKNGKYHGQGVMEYLNGDRYEGKFQNGKKHGQGKYDWDGGQDYYDGEWINDSAEGNGTSMIDGQFYTGEFKNGKRHGQGQMTTLDGDFIKAIWQDGKIRKQIERNGQLVEE